jgi:hypothetical protein
LVPPPFSLTPLVFAALSRIDQSLGRLQGLAVTHPQPLLRKRKWLQYQPPTSSSAPSTIQAAKLASEGPCTAQRIRVRCSMQWNNTSC